MQQIKVIAIDYNQGFPILGKQNGAFIRTPIQRGCMSEKLKHLDAPLDILEPDREEVIQSLLMEKWDEPRLMVSRDHMMTYYGLQCCRQPGQDVSLIVLDQHLDIYSYATHGADLNKCNALRFCYDAGLFRNIYFVGIRESEQAEFDNFHRMFIQNYSEFTNNKKYAGFEDIVHITTAGQVGDLSVCFQEIIEDIKRSGSRYVGVDIDLDCFDTAVIKGVQFNPQLVAEVRKQIGDYSADFIAEQLAEKGLPVSDIEQHVYHLCRYIHDAGLQLSYRGITEYEPENDFDNSTADTICRIVGGFQKGL